MTPTGLVQGWVRDTRQRAPSRVQIRLGTEIVAEAVASDFRADLLRAGNGHGHYGFRARLHRPVPPGLCRMDMHLPDQDVSAPMPVTVPALDRRHPVAVESLLGVPAGWCAQDVLARPDCLDMEANCAAMGLPRFVDAVFRFAFGRWPTDAEAQMNTDSLRAGRISAPGLLAECLVSAECRERPPGLPSPFSAGFPFGSADQAGGSGQ